MTTNGSISTPSDESVLPFQDPEVALAIAALAEIAIKAEQAVKKLEDLTGGPVLPPSAPDAPVRAVAAFSPTALAVGAPELGTPVAIAAVPTGPTAKSGQMNPGDVLHPGDSITSANGNYLLAMQTDGNLVLYSGSCALWASNTPGKPAAVCIMQGDGNLVIYDRSSHALWASSTAGRAGARLVVQDDGNVVIYQKTGAPAWATNTVHTVGADTLIYRSRLKRWTNLIAFGSKGNDTVLVKLPPGATLKSVTIAPADSNNLNPNVNSPIGTEIGGSYSGARLTNVVTGPGFVAITTHWWFSAFSDAEYSISVWATGPTAFPVEDNGAKISANVDKQIAAQVGRWWENNGATVIAAAVALASVCADIASLGAAVPVTTPTLVAAIGQLVTAGSKVAFSSSN